ncbi:hypothetical protein Lesp02_29500 [Lentzea sp. NBRC 105346]|uniref:hypothetical protein n=1 Tax=Lentzea sp. NBRC 105346 TaxID=3032205 RepID=UPI0024A3BEC8|nr:hypothetical protein [Lentzea sp. NBRC 105346]GLZ30761.1 hypothetical protein Lesp02_29500 [Lentzea sp. NBRC 105346]
MNTQLIDLPRHDYDSKGMNTMSLNEELVRIRIHEAQRYAEEQRLAHRLSSAQRWRRLSSWAARRAARFDRSL